ncbi:GNAT family N-acetyltransferase [Microbacterium sp. BK668]|uniref:GNAT family N-acetyltransferase n=1 Tax=Microbacterium sp. BK668 TaxID=2512118 RepID=UPI00105FB546|nr:GNAT family N-acetyltransferase [Microbacterium sp. BK668]TDN90855.1 RimJ/RimL family protein N-acetyltransferase [Microbacterium sp. BK668]
MSVTIAPWGPDDLPLLERLNTPEMTRYLGRPENSDELLARHERYLLSWEAGHARMFRIEVDGEPAGGIGWWTVEHDGMPAYETGWSVVPEFQGRGVAGAALRLVIGGVREAGDRHLLVAYPGVENAASNALCRRAGFEHRGSASRPWRDGELTFNVWVLDMSPLDLTGRTPDIEERFDEGVLDETLWWPFYTPHWSSRERAAARYTVGAPGLELRIEAETPPWAPDLDGELRVSHLQTGQSSGPLGSGIGQHRFRPGLVVREAQPERRLWLARFGVVEARLAAIHHPDAMVALWPIGFEDAPDDCGEICIAEIFGAEIDDTGGWVGVGVKPQNDPRLSEDFEKIRVDGDLTQFHEYAVEWTPERLRFFIDHRWVKTVAQTIDYPVQLMLDVYEFPPAEGERDAAALPHRFRVAWVRTYPPATSGR